jgi:Deoxynucleoside kinases
MKMIALAGMIGAGKSTLAQILGEELDAIVKFEKIPDILHKFQDASNEKEAIVYLTQMTFMNQRIRAWRECILGEHQDKIHILDRSFFEDRLFAETKNKYNQISDLQLESYIDTWETAFDEIKLLPKKMPDLTIYLRASWEHIEKNIIERGRDFENTEDGMRWNKDLHSEYDDFMFNRYSHGEVLIIDVDGMDFEHDLGDRTKVIKQVLDKLIEMNIVQGVATHDVLLPQSELTQSELPFSQWAVGKTVKVTAPWFVEQGITEAVVNEVFRAHKQGPEGELTFMLDCKVPDRKNGVALYEGQYEFLD